MEQTERLKILVDTLAKGNQAKFAETVGIERSMFNRIFKGAYPLTERSISRIVSGYPVVNPDFLRGNTEYPGDIEVKPVKSKDEIIREKDAEIAYLRKSIDLLETLIQKIDRQ